MEKKSVGLLELKTAVLECFLEKTPLSPLGVNSTGAGLLNYQTSKNNPISFWTKNSLWVYEL
jgi:hypothetical protein